MTLDSWNDLFNVASVGLVALTFFVGLGALITGRQVNQRQRAQLLQLSTDLAKAQTGLAEQQTRAAIAEKALLDLQERARPRTVDAACRAILLERLKIGQPLIPVSVEFVGGSTSEPYGLATALAEILREARWTVQSFDGGPALGNPPVGINVRVSGAVGPTPQAQQLVDTLNLCGLDARIRRDNRITDQSIVLVVGLKP
jgi:hypothetical protein